MSSASAKPLFLGLDLSTQQIKTVLLDEHSEIAHESAVHFDRDLPQYGTTNGAIRGPDEGEVTSPVKMWLDAIDLLLQRLKDDGIEFSAIASISGAGQVRCSLSRSDNHYLIRFIEYVATWISVLVERCGRPPCRTERKSKPSRTVVSRGIFIPKGTHLARFINCRRLQEARNRVRRRTSRRRHFR